MNNNQDISFDEIFKGIEKRNETLSKKKEEEERAYLKKVKIPQKKKKYFSDKEFLSKKKKKKKKKKLKKEQKRYKNNLAGIRSDYDSDEEEIEYQRLIAPDVPDDNETKYGFIEYYSKLTGEEFVEPKYQDNKKINDLNNRRTNVSEKKGMFRRRDEYGLARNKGGGGKKESVFTKKDSWLIKIHNVDNNTQKDMIKDDLYTYPETYYIKDEIMDDKEIFEQIDQIRYPMFYDNPDDDFLRNYYENKKEYERWLKSEIWKNKVEMRRKESRRKRKENEQKKRKREEMIMMELKKEGHKFTVPIDNSVEITNEVNEGMFNPDETEESFVNEDKKFTEEKQPEKDDTQMNNMEYNFGSFYNPNNPDNQQQNIDFDWKSHKISNKRSQKTDYQNHRVHHNRKNYQNRSHNNRNQNKKHSYERLDKRYNEGGFHKNNYHSKNNFNGSIEKKTEQNVDKNALNNRNNYRDRNRRNPNRHDLKRRVKNNFEDMVQKKKRNQWNNFIRIDVDIDSTKKEDRFLMYCFEVFGKYGFISRCFYDPRYFYENGKSREPYIQLKFDSIENAIELYNDRSAIIKEHPEINLIYYAQRKRNYNHRFVKAVDLTIGNKISINEAYIQRKFDDCEIFVYTHNERSPHSINIRLDLRKYENINIFIELRFKPENVKKCKIVDSGKEEDKYFYLKIRSDNPPIIYRNYSNDIEQVGKGRLELGNGFCPSVDFFDKRPGFVGIEHIHSFLGDICKNSKKLGIGYSRYFVIKFDKKWKEDIMKIKKTCTDFEIFEEKESFTFVNECKYNKEKEKISSILLRFRNENFDVLYLLECCFSYYYILRENLSVSFLEKLEGMDIHHRITFLKEIINQERTFYDIEEELDKYKEKLEDEEYANIIGGLFYSVKQEKYIQSCSVTPNRLVIRPTRIDATNRVIRRFKKFSHHFIRVKFCDDSGRIPKFNEDYLSLVEFYLKNGMFICGRKFTALCASPSQFRSGSYWFFSLVYDKKSKRIINARSIRNWMGNFSDESNNIAKVASKMGLCFSASYFGALIDNDQHVEIPDFKKNGYIFSDGCGRISERLFQQIKSRLPFLRIRDDTSALQIRFMGCKGMLTVFKKPDQNDPVDLYIRPSQSKFSIRRRKNPLDICKWSDYRPLFLNREVIMQLESRDICDTLITVIKEDCKAKNKEAIIKDIKRGIVRESVFYHDCYPGWEKRLYSLKYKGEIFCELVKKQEEMVNNLNKMMSDVDTAIWVLKNYCFDRPISCTLTDALNSGFDLNEPFIHKCFFAISRCLKKNLQRKARIFVKDGGNFFGVIDEYGALEYNQVYIHVKKFNILLGVDEDVVISGNVYVGKNPAEHPGDFRNFEAMDIDKIPNLNEEAKLWYKRMNNVIVFSHKGERPNVNECSGSDLDGDEYCCIWDQSLIPKNDNYEPLDYRKMKPQKVVLEIDKDEKITYSDIVRYYLSFQKVYNLGPLTYQIYSQYAISPFCLLSKKCRELSALYSKAVDSPKTNEEVIVPSHLRIRVRPNYLYADEKKRKNLQFGLFVSKNLIGVLFKNISKELENIEELTYETDRAEKVIEKVEYIHESGEKEEKEVTRYYTILDNDILSKEDIEEFESDQKKLKEVDMLKTLYYEEMGRILQMYDIHNEEDLFTHGFLYYMDSYSMAVRSLAISIRHLEKKFQKYFYENYETEKERIKMSKMWYYVNYKHQDSRSLSFSWIISQFLNDIKKKAKNIQQLNTE